MTINDYTYVMNILKEAYYANPAPSVTLISQTEKTPYHILISTLISLRTKDEVTLKASRKLFEQAPDLKSLAAMEEKEIAQLIYPAGFYKVKAGRLKEIANIIIHQYEQNIPDNMEDLLKLPGVGRKTANLVLILGYGQDSICVDTHVHRVSNRMGWVKTKSPEETEFALKEIIPQQYWKSLNDYLVSYGQMVCKPLSPFCSQCKLELFCPKIGVTKKR
ncbi:MAG: endonuclease III [Spirochaetes bacterium]|nr:endonuclease III [Spirochaetota bacterium]